MILFSIKKKLGGLEWHERLSIAMGAARGLNYLHTCSKDPLIHGDIKPGIRISSTTD